MPALSLSLSSAGMMDGRDTGMGMGMGSFDADATGARLCAAPFDAQFLDQMVILDPLLVRFQGDHLLRQPERAVRSAGLVVDELTRSRFGIVLRLTAHKPTSR